MDRDNDLFFMALFVLFFANLFSIGLVQANDMDRAIEKYRMGAVVVKTEPGAKISLEQVRHEFWFGVAISGSAFNGKFSESDSRKPMAAQTMPIIRTMFFFMR